MPAFRTEKVFLDFLKALCLSISLSRICNPVIRLAIASGLLFLSFFAVSLTHAQQQVTNIATIAPPLSVSNSNPSGSCTVAGVCSASDVDAVTPSRPTVAKSFSAASISAGGTVLLTITITNTNVLASATLTSVFADVYPAGLVNATGVAQTSCTAGAATAVMGAGTLTLSVGTLIPPGLSCTLTSVVTSSITGTVTNTIPSGSLSTSVGTSSNTATATLSVASNADLTLTKTASAANAVAGSTISYTVTLVNLGPSVAQNVTLTDIFSAGLVLSGTPVATGGGVLSSNAGGATVTIASLGVGQS